MREVFDWNRERIPFPKFWHQAVVGGWRFKFHRVLCTEKTDPFYRRFVNLWVSEDAGQAYGFAEPHQTEPGPVPRNLWFFYKCKHECMTRVKLGRCFNRYTCDECGHSYEIDSSD